MGREEKRMAIIELVRLILHYVGFLSVILGITVFFIFRNYDLGNEILSIGISCIVLKYTISFIYIFIFKK